MKDIILSNLVAPLTQSIENNEVNLTAMNRINGFFPSLDESIQREVRGLLDDFEDALEQGDEDFALQQMQKMAGFLEGHALTLKD
jgi:hypothetical protein